MTPQIGTLSFVAPCHALSCGSVSALRVIYGHANEAVCPGRCAAFAQWALEWRPDAARGCESVPNCWHKHGAGRDSHSKMGRWPSQVLTLTDEIKEELGQARQVSGKQTPRDEVRETNTSQSQTEGGEWKVAAWSQVVLGLSSICPNLFVWTGNAESWNVLPGGMLVAKSKRSEFTKVENKFPLFV